MTPISSRRPDHPYMDGFMACRLNPLALAPKERPQDPLVFSVALGGLSPRQVQSARISQPTESTLWSRLTAVIPALFQRVVGQK